MSKRRYWVRKGGGVALVSASLSALLLLLVSGRLTVVFLVLLSFVGELGIRPFDIASAFRKPDDQVVSHQSVTT